MNKTATFEIFPAAARLWVITEGTDKRVATWLWLGTNNGRVEIVRVDEPSLQQFVGETVEEVMEAMTEMKSCNVEFRLGAHARREDFEPNYSPDFIDMLFDGGDFPKPLSHEVEQVIAQTVAAML